MIELKKSNKYIELKTPVSIKEEASAAPVINYKYYANDWAEGVIMADSYGTGELNFCAFKPLPEKAHIVDISVRYNGTDYRLNELTYKSLANHMTIVSVFNKPVYDEVWSTHIVGKIFNETDGALYLDVISMGTAVEGFTVYYMELEEIEVKEE